MTVMSHILVFFCMMCDKKLKVIKMKHKRNMCKWAFVPICLVAVISGILLINSNKELKFNVYKPNIENKDNVSIYINDISKMTEGLLRLDVDLKFANVENILYFQEISNIKIPSDFDNQEAFEIYVKPDRDSNEYTTLQSYVFNYSNRNNDRSIRVSFSKENKPVRDYYFSEEGSRVSKINNIELKIFKYNGLFFTRV